MGTFLMFVFDNNLTNVFYSPLFSNTAANFIFYYGNAYFIWCLFYYCTCVFKTFLKRAVFL